MRAIWLCVGLVLPTGGNASVPPAAVEPGFDQREWLVEQTPGGSVTMQAGTMVIDDVTGCTVWFRERLVAPVEISYDVTVVARGGPHDRVSDVNCFWMASDPKSPGTMPSGRSGRFGDYDSLRLYYVGMGGNDNSTTRFRRYTGDGNKPILLGHELREKQFLLTANQTYRIKVVARDGIAEFWCNDQKFFSFPDPTPLTSGWFAFRTLNSHLEIRNFRVNHFASAGPRN